MVIAPVVDFLEYGKAIAYVIELEMGLAKLIELYQVRRLDVRRWVLDTKVFCKH